MAVPISGVATVSIARSIDVKASQTQWVCGRRRVSCLSRRPIGFGCTMNVIVVFRCSAKSIVAHRVTPVILSPFYKL